MSKTTYGHLILFAAALVLAPITAGAQGNGALNGFSIGPEFGSSGTAPRGPRTLDDIVAVVGDDVILASELDSAVAGVRARNGDRVDRVPPNVLRSQVLDRLIMVKLQVQRAKQRNIKISDDELDAGIARIAQQNNMSMAAFRRAVASDAGMSMDQLRDQVRQQLLIAKLRRREVMAKVSVTPEDVDRYLENQSLRGQDVSAGGQRVMVEELKVSHILLRPNEIRDPQRTRKLAERIRQRLAAGDDFAALARQYSDDSASANQGGELGWIQPGRLDPAARNTLAQLSKGEVSRVLQSPGGYELVRLEGRRQRDQTREAIRQRARQALGEQRSQEEGQLWLRKLRDEAYVDIRLPDYQPTSGG